MTDSEIIDNPALRRFELQDAAGTAFLIYEKMGDSIRLIHTEVPSVLRGKGIGSRLIEGVLKVAERKNMKVIPLCPFVADYIKAHPEHLGLVAESHKYLVENR